MHDDHDGSTGDLGALSGCSDVQVVAPQPVCTACGARAANVDTFCTRCGNALPGDDGETFAAAETIALPAPPQRYEHTVLTPQIHPVAVTPRRGSWLRIAVPVVLLVPVGATVIFAVLWRGQASHAHRLQGRLDTTTAQLDSTRATLATTQAKLASTSALSAKRRAVLLKAQAVLKKVDPLLSDADGIKQITSKIQTARDVFATDSTQMTSNLLDLENYEANPDYYPYVSESALVDEVNSELATVRADYTILTSQDTAFNAASTKFGSHADAFTDAVRSLQTQLKGVAGP